LVTTAADYHVLASFAAPTAVIAWLGSAHGRESPA
jgi:hypothetical protein